MAVQFAKRSLDGTAYRGLLFYRLPDNGTVRVARGSNSRRPECSTLEEVDVPQLEIFG